MRRSLAVAFQGLLPRNIRLRHVLIEVASMNFVMIVEVVLKSVVLDDDLDGTARLCWNAKQEISLPGRVGIPWIELLKVFADMELRHQLKRVPMILEKTSGLQPFQYLPFHRRSRICRRRVRTADIDG